MKNYKVKSLFLSSKMHQSIFLSGQAIENPKYVYILEKTCTKNHRFDSLTSKILSKFFQYYVQKRCFRNKFKCTYIKKEGRRMINETDSEHK